MTLLVPLTSDFCLVASGVLHAANYGAYADSQRLGPNAKGKPRKTVTALCGVRGKPYVGVAEGDDGTRNEIVLKWPPRVAGLEDGQTRCPECFDLSADKRPDPFYWPVPS